MYILITVLHVIFCVFLILVILLQTGKGAGIGAAFGGGSQTVFGPRGAGSFIGKLTGGVAAAFMLTSLVLAYMSSSSATGVADKVKALNEEISSEVEEVEIGTEAKPEPDSEQGQSAPATGTGSSESPTADPTPATPENVPAQAPAPATTDPKPATE
ncbi:MAG: preprotein translocase subunit SecG [Proteobacteria bacterium]|nr:preprotein translocase subunit SecG [Pseudomonadota bacterium]